MDSSGGVVFSRVQALSAGNRRENGASQQAAHALAILHESLIKIGARPAAQRLARLDDVVGELPFSAVERLIAPERTLQEAEDCVNGRVRRYELLRSLAALLPLMFTWFWLGWATFFYSHRASQDPDQGDSPFMLQWEHRFGGRFVLTFTEMAWCDAGIIVLILASIWMLEKAAKRADEDYDDVVVRFDEAMAPLAAAVELSRSRAPLDAREWATEAQEIVDVAGRRVGDLADILNRAEQDREKFLSELSDQSDSFLDTLKSESRQMVEATLDRAGEALQSAIEEERRFVDAELAPMVHQLTTSIEGYNHDSQQYREKLTEFVGAVEQIGSATAEMAQYAGVQQEVTGSIGAYLETIDRSQRDLVGKVTTSANLMAATDTSLNDLGRSFPATIDRLLEQLTNSLLETRTQLDAANERLRAAAYEFTSASEQASNGAESAAPRGTRRGRMVFWRSP
ncbi:hypothetical protein [Frankia sp. AiPs1]